MVRVLSFDVCGTLVDCTFADYVWKEGVPLLYAEKHGIPFVCAKQKVMEEYNKVGGNDIRYFELEYWFQYFNLNGSHHDLVNAYKEMVVVYEEVPDILACLKTEYTLIVASLAHRDLIPVALCDIESNFNHIFSATSDFKYVKKHQKFYREITAILSVDPGDVVHIGDDYVFDYEIPKSIGMHAFLLDRTGQEGLKDLKEFELKIRECES
ncbi:MAG: HAD family hydrolase [Candidatus Methanofastidiosia archaeon]|jgi:putative hydrolase of the HAD superfamily